MLGGVDRNQVERERERGKLVRLVGEVVREFKIGDRQTGRVGALMHDGGDIGQVAKGGIGKW